ncbi:cytochrome c family protein [Sphingomonas humi]|uniref:Cytochrome c domain-containing protein n=1 Tax=Sphingomonas humi TaxID=335630 RepID=A0ABP7REV6_9SPHN
MQDNNNTIAGWVLFAGIVALGGTLATGIAFKSERPEKMGYPIEGVVEEGGAGAAEAEQPIEFYLASADVAKGAEVFKKCQACHNVEQGGANGLGPNLYHVVGEPVGKGRGFAWSDALAGHGGTWDWKTLGEWLANPKKFAPGTKMTFAGLSNPQDRANVIAYLNSNSPAPLPLPAAPAATAAGAAPDKAAAEADDVGAQKAENEPVLTEQEAQKGGMANVRGEGAPKVSAPGTTATPAEKK